MKKKISFLIALFLIIMIMPVYAKEENFYAGEDVIVKNNVESTTFAAGNNVEFTPIMVDGLSFAAGNNVVLSSMQDHLFAAGNHITLKGAFTKDAYLAASRITIEESTIRDLYAAAETIEINSHISRNVYLAGDKVVINGMIDGNAHIAADKIQINDNATIQGTLKYPKDAEITISDKAIIQKTETYIGKKVDTKVTIKSMIMDRVISFASLLLVGICLLMICKNFFAEMKKEEKTPNDFFKKLGIGFIFLIALPIVMIILMVTLIGIPLGLIALVMYIILIYLSKIATAYYLGSWILKDKEINDYLLLAGSLLAVYILGLIPWFGGLVSFASLILGLGIYTNKLKQFCFEKKEEE